MKIKINKLEGLLVNMNQFSRTQTRGHYGAIKTIKAISNALLEAMEMRQAVINKFAVKDSEGKIKTKLVEENGIENEVLDLPKELEEQAKKELYELGESEIEVKIHSIKHSSIKDEPHNVDVISSLLGTFIIED